MIEMVCFSLLKDFLSLEVVGVVHLQKIQVGVVQQFLILVIVYLQVMSVQVFYL